MGGSSSQPQAHVEVKKMETEDEKKRAEIMKEIMEKEKNVIKAKIIAVGDDVRNVKQDPNDVIPGFT